MNDSIENSASLSRPSEPIVLYDGYCNLCNRSVIFILKHERHPAMKFAALQSEFGIKIKSEFGLDPNYSDSFVLLENDKAYLRSDAAIRTCRYLKLPLSLCSVFVVIPNSIRDRIYDWIAGSRYKWFGKKEKCWIPSAEIKERFLDI